MDARMTRLNSSLNGAKKRCCGTCRHSVWPKGKDHGLCQAAWWHLGEKRIRPILLYKGCGSQCHKWAPEFTSYGKVA